MVNDLINDLNGVFKTGENVYTVFDFTSAITLICLGDAEIRKLSGLDDNILKNINVGAELTDIFAKQMAPFSFNMGKLKKLWENEYIGDVDLSNFEFQFEIRTFIVHINDIDVLRVPYVTQITIFIPIKDKEYKYDQFLRDLLLEDYTTISVKRTINKNLMETRVKLIYTVK